MLKNILIVDDSRLIREAIAKILLSVGADKSSIASVENGQDAIDYLEMFPAELIICGDNLLDMSLITLFDRINEQTNLSKMSVLVMHGKEFPAIHSLSERAHQLIEKPFNKKALLSVLSELTGQPIAELNTQDTLSSETNVKNISTKQPTVLIVDDEPSNIDVAASYLKGQYRIIAARSGKQALQIINSQYQTIDLILLDIMMPELDGYQVCETIKSNNKSNKIPVIFLTAKAQVEDITKGFAVGAVDYITKPLQGDILQARVNTHVTLKKSREQLDSQIEQLKETARLREDIEKITQHDLKGPLASVLFHAEKITPKETAQAIKNTVNSVISMINRSLEMYKIEQGRFNYQPQLADLSPIVTDAINAIQLTAKNRSIAINTSNLSNAHNALVEPLFCLSVFNNLVKNAVEAAPDNSEITVTLNDIGSMIRFTCTNQGAIPKELRDSLFDKYASANKHQGSGFGTYSAKLMIEAQNGTIWFDIIDEQATQFIVELPKPA